MSRGAATADGTSLMPGDRNPPMIDETIARIREMRTHSESTVAVDATRAL